MTHESQQIVVALSQDLLRCEHGFAVDAGIDNHEHILRVKRMADAVAAFLGKEGLPAAECARVQQKLIIYARDLFVAAWMQPRERDDRNPPSERDAMRCFDRILNTRR